MPQSRQEKSRTNSKGRPSSGRPRAEIVRLAKAKYRAKLKKEGKILVSVPISQEANCTLKEEAESYGKSTTALMTELLEQAAQTTRTNQQWKAAPTGNGKVAAGRGRQELLDRFADRLVVNPLLTRKLVSFQASKKTPFYRWLKYKEAFSPELVDYLYDMEAARTGESLYVLDPFAGSGTALTRACRRGWKATGIELLPVGASAIKARLLADSVDVDCFRRHLEALASLDWRKGSPGYQFPHLRITQAAFSEETEMQIAAWMRHVEGITDQNVRFLFWFACLTVLEDVSFTRKDGQYLRWDYRSGRELAKRFDKGAIPSFPVMVNKRLREFLEDLETRNGATFSKNAQILSGSCLLEMPRLEGGAFDLVLTSPPYCNRYDYTRTYALELAFCGCGEDDIRRLRQTLLSATVENKSKRSELARYYESLGAEARWKAIESAFDNQAALHEVLAILRFAKEAGQLSNNNVPNLVENYFLEMAQVIYEMERLLRPGGAVMMVNDNVRYHGEEVPVDLILSDFAESAGLRVEKIWVLPKGKGNSSQQMGRWGRQELRKCVYFWRKPAG